MKSKGCVLDLHGGGGTVWRDHSAHGNDGTLDAAGMRTTLASGLEVMECNGTSDYADCGNDASLDITAAITIEAWVKSDSPASPSHQTLVNKSTTDNYQLRFYSNTRRMKFLLKLSGGDEEITGDTALDADTWYHIAGAYDGSAMNLFVDGAAAATPVAATGSITTNAEPLIIGSWRDLAYWFDGRIYRPRIHTYAFTLAQVQAIYNRECGLFGKATV